MRPMLERLLSHGALIILKLLILFKQPPMKILDEILTEIVRMELPNLIVLAVAIGFAVLLVLTLKQ